MNDCKSDYDRLTQKYDRLKYEFNSYQSLMEKTVQDLNEKNFKLEKKLDVLSNVIEISKYLNSMISDDNLLSAMNDIIIGIIGSQYSSILLKENNTLVVKATNIPDIILNGFECTCDKLLKEGKSFINNSRENIVFFKYSKEVIHSLMQVPICLKDNILGCIILEHTLYNFFNEDHMKFVTAVANQMGMAIENNNLYYKIRENSIRDPLLGIYNRKYFYDYVEKQINMYHNQPFGIVMIDFDDFKSVNDMYGHQYGDEVLISTARIVKEGIDEKDVFARYGGEEFIIYISDMSDKNEVFKKIDNIREKVEKNFIKYRSIKNNITASFGVSFYPESGNTLESIIRKADHALYAAKRYGKNKVIME